MSLSHICRSLSWNMLKVGHGRTESWWSIFCSCSAAKWTHCWRRQGWRQWNRNRGPRHQVNGRVNLSSSGIFLQKLTIDIQNRKTVTDPYCAIRSYSTRSRSERLLPGIHKHTSCIAFVDAFRWSLIVICRFNQWPAKYWKLWIYRMLWEYQSGEKTSISRGVEPVNYWWYNHHIDVIKSMNSWDAAVWKCVAC